MADPCRRSHNRRKTVEEKGAKWIAASPPLHSHPISLQVELFLRSLSLEATCLGRAFVCAPSLNKYSEDWSLRPESGSQPDKGEVHRR